VTGGLLRINASRPTLYGLEMHLVSMYKKINEFQPALVVIDPISDLTAVGNPADVKNMLTRLLDYLKNKQITAILLDLSANGETEKTGVGISSLADTWINLRDIELSGERNRGLYVLKSRGMAHSNQVREFVLSDEGISLLDVYTGNEGVLTGAARLAQENREKAGLLAKRQEVKRRQREIERKRRRLETTIVELQTEFDAEKEELEALLLQDEDQVGLLEEYREQMARQRKAD
jgi:circadian clock protein KaiC